MKKLDFKSMLIGILTTGLLFSFYSFDRTADTSMPQVGKFQAVSSERGFLILDTQSGDYILDSEVNYVGKMTWIKGDFESAFRAGKDKTKD
ncbi:MAG: hypothetical protein Sapg2KO_34480 [Saprospiraceae bacterium]